MTKAEELEAVLDVVRATLSNCQRQNKRLILGLKYYADKGTYRYCRDDVGWKPIDHDQGIRARDILTEIGIMRGDAA